MSESMKPVPPASARAVDGARPVVAAVMAAGLSRRMGPLNKLVQPIDGVPMVRRVAEQALASRCSRVLVVVGHRANEVREALAGLPVQFIENPQYCEGLAASVRAAARAVRPDEALAICLGDMPRVSTAVIDRLIDAYQGLDAVWPDRARPHHPPDENRVASAPAAFQPEFGGRRGNPVLWTPKSVSLLMSLSGDEGARTVLKRLGNGVTAVPVQSDGIFMDVDTPEALSQARRQTGLPQP